MNIVIFDDRESTAELMRKHFGSSIEPIVTTDMAVSDILDRLAGEAERADAIYISGELKFKEVGRRSHQGGLRLLEHIRLTEGLGRARLLPVGIGLWRSMTDYLRDNPTNLVAFSKGCSLIRMPASLAEIEAAVVATRGFGSVDELLGELRSYVLFSPADAAVTQHDFRNRVGVPKLLTEGLGLVAASLPLVQEFERLRKTELWLKKHDHLERVDESAGAGRSEVQPTGEASTNSFEGKRFILMDDEHRRGWSYALYRLLIGDIDENAFNDPSPVLGTPGGRFTCVDSFDAAERLLGSEMTNLESALVGWVDADFAFIQAAERHGVAGRELKQAEAAQRAAESAYSAGVEAFERLSRESEDARAAFQSAADVAGNRFAEIVTGSDPNIDIQDRQIQGQIDELFSLKKRYIMVLSSHGESKTRMTQTESAAQAAVEKLHAARERFGESDKLFTAAKADHDNAVRRLGRGFPFDLVLLDMRLDRVGDRGRPLSETTGIKLLNLIKILDPSVPVIIFTASNRVISYERALELGADGYWVKAVSTARDLLATVAACIEHSRTLRDLWLKIRMVERRRVLYAHTLLEDGSVRQRELRRGDIEREQIVKWLKESFLLLKQRRTEYEQLVLEYDVYNRVALNMGLIQEVRYREGGTRGAIEGKFWYELIRAGKVPRAEQDVIRNARKDAAHAYAGGASQGKVRTATVGREKAVESFRLTLQRLLAPSS